MPDDLFETTRDTYTLKDLFGRVTKVEGAPVIRLFDVPRGTPDTLMVMSARAIEMGRALGEPFGVIVDLSEADGAPTSAYRKAIPKYAKELATGAAYMTIAWQGQPMARMAATLLLNRFAKNVSVHENFDDALARLIQELGK